MHVTNNNKLPDSTKAHSHGDLGTDAPNLFFAPFPPPGKNVADFVPAKQKSLVTVGYATEYRYNTHACRADVAAQQNTSKSHACHTQ